MPIEGLVSILIFVMQTETKPSIKTQSATFKGPKGPSS